MDFLPFNPNLKPSPQNHLKGEIPKELDIFSQDETEFLPEGKSFDDLTKEELKELKDKYRFGYFIPGLNQTITGFGGMI